MYDTFFILLSSFFHALISTSFVFLVILFFGFVYFYLPIKLLFAMNKEAAKESIGNIKKLFAEFKIKDYSMYVFMFCSALILQTVSNFIIGMHL